MSLLVLSEVSLDLHHVDELEVLLLKLVVFGIHDVLGLKEHRNRRMASQTLEQVLASFPGNFHSRRLLL